MSCTEADLNNVTGVKMKHEHNTQHLEQLIYVSRGLTGGISVASPICPPRSRLMEQMHLYFNKSSCPHRLCNGNTHT